MKLRVLASEQVVQTLALVQLAHLYGHALQRPPFWKYPARQLQILLELNPAPETQLLQTVLVVEPQV